MPLTEKGQKILSNMTEHYGSPEKAKQVLYASKNAGKITGIDQSSPDFLDQLKNFARGFLSWVSEEGSEPEHPGTTTDQVVPMSQPDETDGQQSGPLPVRTRTTTVTDYADASAPVAPTRSTTATPADQGEGGGANMSGGARFTASALAERDQGQYSHQGFEGLDDGERFALSPDGSTIIDKQGGASYSIEDAMRILFSDGNSDDTMQGGELGEQSQQGWNVPAFPPQKDNDPADPGEGMGGKILGQLLKFKAGEDCGDTAGSLKPQVRVPNAPVTKSAVPTGRLAAPKINPSMRVNDGGPGSGPRPAGKSYPMGVMSSVYSGPAKKPAAQPATRETHPMGIYDSKWKSPRFTRQS